VKMSGVARVNVSRNANCVPAAPLSTAANTANGDAPPASTSSAATMKLATIATKGARTQMRWAVSARGSSRIGFARETVAGHHGAELADRYGGACQRRRHVAAIHDDHAIRQRQEFVQVLRDQQDAGAIHARLQELLVDVADRTDVEAASRLVRENDARRL